MTAEQFISKYYDDFQAADWQAFGSHLSEDFTYYTDQCIVQSKEELLQFLASNPWPVKHFEISDFSTLSGSNENLCVVTYKIARRRYYLPGKAPFCEAKKMLGKFVIVIVRIRYW
jgi:hypothetical protein